MIFGACRQKSAEVRQKTGGSILTDRFGMTDDRPLFIVPFLVDMVLGADGQQDPLTFLHESQQGDWSEKRWSTGVVVDIRAKVLIAAFVGGCKCYFNDKGRMTKT